MRDDPTANSSVFSAPAAPAPTRSTQLTHAQPSDRCTEPPGGLLLGLGAIRKQHCCPRLPSRRRTSCSSTSSIGRDFRMPAKGFGCCPPQSLLGATCNWAGLE